MEELLVKIRAREDKRSELLQTCHYIAERTLQVPGCKGSLLLQDSEKGDPITLEQQWDRRSFLNDYIRSEHFTALLGAIKWLGQSFEVQINGSTHEEGMKVIQFERMT